MATKDKHAKDWTDADIDGEAAIRKAAGAPAAEEAIRAHLKAQRARAQANASAKAAKGKGG